MNVIYFKGMNHDNIKIYTYIKNYFRGYPWIHLITDQPTTDQPTNSPNNPNFTIDLRQMPLLKIIGEYNVVFVPKEMILKPKYENKPIIRYNQISDALLMICWQIGSSRGHPAIAILGYDDLDEIRSTTFSKLIPQIDHNIVIHKLMRKHYLEYSSIQSNKKLFVGNFDLALIVNPYRKGSVFPRKTQGVENLHQYQLQTKRLSVFLDSSPFRTYGDEYRWTHRIILNHFISSIGISPTSSNPDNSQRWDSFKLKIKPWRKHNNGHILIILYNSNGYTSDYMPKSSHSWLDHILNKINTNRQIRLRTHPSDPTFGQYKISKKVEKKRRKRGNQGNIVWSNEISLLNDLNNCWCAICPISHVGLVPLLEGIPLLSYPESVAYPLSIPINSKNLKTIDKITITTDVRLGFFHKIAYCIWFEKEMKEMFQYLFQYLDQHKLWNSPIP